MISKTTKLLHDEAARRVYSGGGRCATSIFEQLIANAICTLVEINGAFYINLECKEFYPTLLSFSPCAQAPLKCRI
jgi:hypothetical protein